MRSIGAVFRTCADALSATRTLVELGLGRGRWGILTPGRDRASLGDAAVAGVIPGVGPAVGVGALDGVLTATTKNAPLQAQPTDGHSRDDMDAYHEALRRGHSVVIVIVTEGTESSSARDSLLGAGESLEAARLRWEEEAQDFALAASILRPSFY